MLICWDLLFLGTGHVRCQAFIFQKVRKKKAFKSSFVIMASYNNISESPYALFISSLHVFSQASTKERENPSQNHYFIQITIHTFNFAPVNITSDATEHLKTSTLNPSRFQIWMQILPTMPPLPLKIFKSPITSTNRSLLLKTENDVLVWPLQIPKSVLLFTWFPCPLMSTHLLCKV